MVMDVVVFLAGTSDHRHRGRQSAKDGENTLHVGIDVCAGEGVEERSTLSRKRIYRRPRGREHEGSCAHVLREDRADVDPGAVLS